MSLEELNDQLKLRDKLDAQVKNLSAKLAEKRGQIEAVHLSGKDSKEISKEVRQIETELKELSAAAEQARKHVEELTQKQAEADKIARMDDLRNREQEAYKTMITNLFELGNAIDNLTGIHRILKMYGCTPRVGLSSNLIRVIFSELDYLKFVQPDLFGQDPNPDQIEIIRSDISHEIERLKELISIRIQADQKQMYPELLVDYERALEIAQARLEQLPLSNQDGK